MKKIFYILVSAIVALGAVACDNQGWDEIDAPTVIVNGDTVSFVASIETNKTDLDANLKTTWVAGDVIVVDWNGTEYEFTNTEDNVNLFSGKGVGLSKIVDQNVKATYSYGKSGKINSAEGKAGALLVAEGEFGKLVFGVQNAFLKVTTTGPATLSGKGLFSNGDTFEITEAVTDKYIAINPVKDVVFSYTINGVKCNKKITTFTAKNIYKLGTLTAATASAWSIIGDNTSWASDITMYNTSTSNVFVAYDVEFTDASIAQGDCAAYNEFKIRQNKAWTTSYGVGACVQAGYKVKLLSRNTGLEENGTYDIYFNSSTKEIAVMPNGKTWSDALEPKFNDGNATCTWGIVGSMTSWNAPDITMYWDGTYWYAKGVQFESGDTFKCRQNAAWSWQYGNGNKVSATSIGNDGDNIKATAKCQYDVYVSKTQHKVWFKTAGTRP